MKEKYKKYIGNKAFYMMVMAIAVPILIQNASESLNLILMEKPFPLKKNQKSQNQTTVSQDYTSTITMS